VTSASEPLLCPQCSKPVHSQSRYCATCQRVVPVSSSAAPVQVPYQESPRPQVRQLNDFVPQGPSTRAPELPVERPTARLSPTQAHFQPSPSPQIKQLNDFVPQGPSTRAPELPVERPTARLSPTQAEAPHAAGWAKRLAARVPGFRSGRIWHSGLAALTYAAIIWFIVGGAILGSTPLHKAFAIGKGLWVLAALLFATNTLGLRRHMPAFNSPRRLSRAIPAWVVFVIAVAVISNTISDLEPRPTVAARKESNIPASAKALPAISLTATGAALFTPLPTPNPTESPSPTPAPVTSDAVDGGCPVDFPVKITDVKLAYNTDDSRYASMFPPRAM
jgi:hypothetical protein